MTDPPTANPTITLSSAPRVRSDVPFTAALWTMASMYLILIIAMLVAMALYTTQGHIVRALESDSIRYAIKLSLISCTLTTIVSLWVAVPIGYLMSRHQFPGKAFIDGVLDIPIVLPPLVVGLALLILFNKRLPFGLQIEEMLNSIGIHVTYDVAAVVLAQFMVACAFAVRTMRITFDQINPRAEQVALTLGCNRAQAFWSVAFPQAGRGTLTAATLAWARSMGEFGPVLVFAGATRMRTEVLPTTVFLELSVGDVHAAVAVSLIMVTAAMIVLVLARVFGLKKGALV